MHYKTTFSITQQQLTQVFSASKTQAPASSGGDTFSLSPWILLIGVLLLLLVGGNIFFWRLVLARSKANNKKMY